MNWLETLLRILSLIGAVALLAVGLPLRADSWSPPTTETASSASGAWRFTVEPSPIESALRYFREEVRAAQEGREVERPAPLGLLERRTPSGHWVQVWAGPLVNAVAPANFLVAGDGHVVTFDNWHSVGYGKDVVVIYDPDGRLVREMALTDFVPQDYIDALPHSVSSLSWRKKAGFSPDDRQLLLEMRIPGNDRDAPGGLGFRINLADGTIDGPTAGDMAAAQAESERVRNARLTKERERLAYLVSPLAVPKGCEPASWHDYLREAHLRLTPFWLDSPVAATKILLPPEDPRYRESLSWLKEAIEQEADYPGEVAIASPCNEAALEPAIRRALQKIPAGALSKSIFYISASDETRIALEPLFADSGATVQWLDPTASIDQRPERVPGSMEEAAADEERMRRQMQMTEDLMEGL